MNQIPRSDWLPEWARWSYAVLSGFFAWSRKIKDHFFGALSHIINPLHLPSLFGQDGWILASFFFWVFKDLDFVSVHKHAKKELGQYPAILTSLLVDNPDIERRTSYIYVHEFVHTVYSVCYSTCKMFFILFLLQQKFVPK